MTSNKINQIEKVVILGGGYAGTLATMRLARKNKNIKITLINAQETFVERIRLHQFLTGQPYKQLFYKDLFAGKNVDFLACQITDIDLNNRLVKVNQAGKEKQIPYDRLVYALGSLTDTSIIDGLEKYTYSLNSLAKSLEIKDKLTQLAKTNGKLVICGGGLTGIESATEIAEIFPTIKITLVTKDVFGSQLSQKAKNYLNQVFAKSAITVKDKTRVLGVSKNSLQLSSGNNLEFDLCLWAGAFTVPKIAKQSGLMVNNMGQILTDMTLRSLSHSEVYAVGDAATINGIELRMSCASAMPLGAHAVDNICNELIGKDLRPFSFAFAGRSLSLGRKNGLIQVAGADDVPKESIITGRLAALIKEFICRYTVWSIKLEQKELFAYTWPKSNLQLLEAKA